MDEQLNQPAPEPETTGSRFRDTFSTLAIIILAPLLAIFLTTFVFQTYEVDGPSMETTLSNKDRLIVLKLPRTWAKVTGNPYIPKRYDIVIFDYAGDYESSADKKQLIKRVIGIPGDRVVVKDGVVTVFNEENPRGYLVDREGPEVDTITNTTGSIDATVKEGQVFVMGDNRNNSLDSRAFGAISADNVVGRLEARIFPLGKAQQF